MTSAHVKLLFLSVCVGFIYWQDFAALWQTASKSLWAVFTLTIIFLVCVFIYQRRGALKALTYISESHNKRGALFLTLAILVYIVGSYTKHWLSLHLVSLLLFISAYLTLLIDFRIPRMMCAPFLASLFLAPPPIGELTSLIAFSVIGVFAAYVILASSWWKVKSVKPCSLCGSDKGLDETFCPHCGRELSLPKPKLTGSFVAKIFVLLMIGCILVSASIPLLSLADEGAVVTTHMAHGTYDQPILQDLPGWDLNSSTRLVEYEKEHLEDFAILYTYVSGDEFQNISQVLLEVSSSSPYGVGSWRHMPGWRKIHEERVALSEDVIGLYIVQQEQTGTLPVLCWVMKLFFKEGSTYWVKQVGVSIFMNLTQPVGELEIPAIGAELRNMGISMINRWNFANLWTRHVATLSEIYVRFKDIFLTILSVVGVFSVAGWARAKDDEVGRLAENALFLLKDEALLLAAVSVVKRRFTGATLFDAYKRLAKFDDDISQFYVRLNELSRFRLVERDHVLKNCRLMMVWKRRVP